MKFWQALLDTKFKKRDDTPMEKLEYNKVQTAIDRLCDQYLRSPSDILYFEALPSAIDSTLTCVESMEFQEKYEFAQESETIFAVRLRELDILN